MQSKHKLFLRKLPRKRSSLYGLKKRNCTACLKCEEVCPVKAIDITTYPEAAHKNITHPINQFSKQKEVYKFHFDFSKCIYCNACVQVCETKALFAYQGESNPSLKKVQMKKNLIMEKNDFT